MSKRAHSFLILFLIPLFLCLVTDQEHGSSSLIQFLGKAINFVILFGGLAYFLHKPLRRFLEKRSEDIQRTQREAEEARNEAERKLEEANVQLEKLGDEVERIKKDAEREGEKEKKRILEAGQKEAERMKHIAQAQIDMYVAAGMRELREFTAEMAAKVAEERIKKRMTPEEHSLFIDRGIEKLSN